MQMPRNGFDSLAALARLNTDSTSHHRERWPSLAWVWDELDELRRWQDEAIDAEDYATLEKEFEEASDERDAITEQRDAITEQRDALSTAVRLLLEPEPDMERVQAVLMGVGHD
jgi:hypothetical protein